MTMIPIRRALWASSLRRPVLLPPRRYLPIPAFRLYSASLKPEEYHKAADETMDRLTSELEDLLEDNDIQGSDVEYSSGVLTLKLGRHGTYVINKQPPNQQIWLSSPTSGPKRYDFESGEWVYQRDKSSMKALLEKELSRIFSQDISLPILPDD